MKYQKPFLFILLCNLTAESFSSSSVTSHDISKNTITTTTTTIQRASTNTDYSKYSTKINIWQKVWKRDIGISLGLFATHLSIMGSKIALPTTFALLTSPEHCGLIVRREEVAYQEMMSKMLFVSTLAISFGKMCFGPFIDKYGGISSLKCLLTSLMVLLSIIGTTQYFIIFSLCWILVDLGFSACWPSLVNSLHQVYPPDEWSGKIGMLAGAARTGNASAFLLFGAILQSTMSWRSVFLTSAALQIIPLLLLQKYGNAAINSMNKSRFNSNEYIAPQPQNNLTNPSFLETLSQVGAQMKHTEYWLHLISRSAMMIYISFLLFVPTFMTHAFDMTSAAASKVGSFYALGCLLSITIGSKFYSDLSSKKKITVMATSLVLASISAIASLLHVSRLCTLSKLAGSFLMFLWGFSSSLPFYLPPALFALKQGGNKSSATIIDTFDIASFGLLALFNGFTAGKSHEILASWIPVFKLLSGCALVSLISLPLAIWLENKPNNTASR